MDAQTKAVPEVLLCPKHNQPEEFTCFDPACIETPGSCVLCIKEVHSTCKDDLIIESDRLEELVTFPADPEPKATNLDKFKEIISAKEAELKSKIDATVRAFDVLSNKDIRLFEQEEATLRLLKRFYEIRENPDTKKVEIKPIFQGEDVEKCLKHYGDDLNSVVSTLEKSLKEVQIELSGSLAVSKFKCHDSIVAQKKGGSINLKRGTSNKEFNYFAAILSQPLKALTKLHLTIEGINSGDPFLDIGVFDQSKLNGYMTSKVISFSNGTYSYCGTSYSNLEGSAQGLVFKKGVQFHMIYDRSKGLLEFTNKQKSWSLKTNALNKDDTHYLYFVLYHPEAEISIRKLGISGVAETEE